MSYVESNVELLETETEFGILRSNGQVSSRNVLEWVERRLILLTIDENIFLEIEMFLTSDELFIGIEDEDLCNIKLWLTKTGFLENNLMIIRIELPL